MSRFGVFTINKVEYDLDDLTLDEVEAIEDRCGGVPMPELNYGSAKTMKAIAYQLMLRNNPELAYEEVGKVKIIDFVQPDEEMPDLPPEQGAESPNGSEPAAAGAPQSVESIAG